MDRDAVHDDPLFEILRQCKTLPVFLDRIFGFLNRRTDFYHVASDERSAVGLPPGLAEEIVKRTFYKWKAKQPNILVPEAVEEVEIVEEQALDEAGVTGATTITDQETDICDEAIKPEGLEAEASTFTSSESYNGAVCDGYAWSQTLRETDLELMVPPGASTKDLDVRIQSDGISVGLKTGEMLLEGELCQRCKHTEAMWSLQNGKLSVHLEKCKEMWWDCFVKSEPKLDVNKLDCTRPFEDLDEEAQAKIEELQWNQDRKRKGLPTSDEMAMNSLLEKAWHVEGSPFSGPFDPSSVKLN